MTTVTTLPQAADAATPSLRSVPRATAASAAIVRRARRLVPMAASAALMSLLAMPAAQAQVQAPATSSSGGEASRAAGSPWALGIGVASRQMPYAGADRDTTAIPLVFYENSWFRLAGPNAEFKLLNYSLSPTQRLSGGLRVKYSSEGYEDNDSPRLAGMAERKGGFWGGAGLTWHNPVAQISADWTGDLSGHSKGQRVQLQVERRMPVGSFSLTPRLGAQWMDSKYVDYYYGVRASEATAARAAYSAKSATAIEAGLRVDYGFNRHHAVFVDLSVTGLPDEIKDSPIVDRSSVSRVAVGYLYRF